MRGGSWRQLVKLPLRVELFDNLLEEEPPTWRGGGGWKCYKLHLVSGQVIGDLLWLDWAGDERRATKVKPAAAGAAGGGSVASVAGDGFACRQ